MKAFYPDKLEHISHISRTGLIYQLDSLRKMAGIYAALKEVNGLELEVVDFPQADAEVFTRFHTPDFVQALVSGKGREEFIESCGVLWQPYLPLAMTNRAHAAIKALQYLHQNNGDLSIIISDGGHHTPPFQAYGFGPINAIGIAINTLLATHKDTKIGILDLDVHQGNGFSYILNENTSIYDLWNKKLEKWPVLNNPQYHGHFIQHIEEYFPTLEKVFEQIQQNKPEIVVYYAGVDVLEDDRMTGIPGFTLDLLKEREKQVFSFLKREGIKTMVTIGGGYVDYSNQEKVDENRKKLIDKHMVTLNTAVESFRQ